MNTLVIEPMTTDADMEGKGFVHYTSWQETYKGLVDATYLNEMSIEKCVEMAKRWPDNILVAKIDGKVVGFVSYGKSPNADLENAGEIFALYVLKYYQHQKIGLALMNAAFEHLKDFKTIVLWVLKGNEHAIHFYETYGFSFDGASEEIVLGTTNTELRMLLRK